MIQAQGLTKQFADQRAVDQLDFELAQGQTLALIGPSGCGKTTTLRMLNRLTEPSGGDVRIDGQSILQQDAIEVRRRIGYVMQGGGLFPHWTATHNVGLVPRLLDWDASRIEQRVAELMELVDLPIDTFGQRYPGELSGGQRQRVGIARALAADPPIVLWDEPFSALDPITRKQLQQEFVRLKQSLGKTMVIVTHDMEEALALADRILVLRDGKLQQCGSVTELLESPANEFVREFVSMHTQ